MTSKTRNICLICLKRFGNVEEEPGYQIRVLSPSSGLVRISQKDELNQHQDLYTRFLYFVNRYLKLTVASERFLSGAAKRKHGEDGPVQAFCESCQELVSYVCDLYTELNAVKLHLFWKLEKLGEVMVKGKKAVSEKLARGLLKSLVTQLNVNAASSILSIRQHIVLKSKLKLNGSTPKVLVHRGLFPEHWFFTYSATKRSLMVLIVIFALASSAVYAKKRVEAVKTDVLAKPKGRGRSKKGVTFMDIKNNFDHHRRPIIKNEKNDDTVDAKGSENYGGAGDGENCSDNDDGPPETFGNDAADSDWSHGAASPTSVGSAGSDVDFDPTTDSNHAPTTRRWNLRRTRKRVLKMGAAKDEDMSDEDTKVNKEVKERKRRPKLTVTTDDRPRTLPCTKCNKTFVDTRGLSKHLLHIHGSCIDYSCPHCGLKFKKLQQMQMHKRKMHRYHRGGRGAYARGRAPVESRCSVCNELFPTRNSMLAHKREAHKIRWTKHECPVCFKTVVSEGRFQRHMRAHEQNVAKDVKMYYCEVCGKHFYKESSLSDHIVKVHDGSFPCSLCDAKYPSSRLLRTHLETHETNEKSFFCTYCFRGFTTQQYYDVHRKLTHRDKGKMFCDKEQCTEEFESIELLNEHLETHVAEILAKRQGSQQTTVEKIPSPPDDGNGRAEVTATTTTSTVAESESISVELSTPVPNDTGSGQDSSNNDGSESKEKCDKENSKSESGDGATTSSPSGTNKLVEEDGTKVFKCSQCGWGFLKKYNLVLHELVHTPHNKDRTGYDCPKCGKNVRYLDTLLTHFNRVHGARIKQYKCEECNSSFSSQIWYKVHMKLHEERKSGKKFICETCNKDCLDSVSLAKHMRDHKNNRVMIPRRRRYFDEMDPSSPPPDGGKRIKKQGPGRPRVKPRTQKELDKEKEEAAKWLQVPCEVCSETFESAYSLRKHLENNHEDGNKSAYCYFCDVNFTYKQTRDLHIRAIHREKKQNYECDDGKCEETFKTVTELNEHLKSHLGENPQQKQEEVAALEPMLDEQTGALIEPELPAETETPKKVITYCSLCEWGFLNKDLMELHQLVHIKKEEEGYPCPRCEIGNFNFIPQLQQHYNKYHGSNIKPFKCFECDKTFFSRVTQLNHIKRHNVRRKQDPGATYICIDCGAQYIDAKLLAKHRKRHDPANHVKCTEPGCDLMFEERKYLNVHLKRVHNKGVKYPCEICGVSFIHRSYIKQHMVSHQEGTFPCEICDRKFKRPHTLRKHLQIHDANRIATHICAECGMGYKSESGLKFHVGSMHTPESEKRFPCPHCPKRYHRKMLLEMHLKACMRSNGIVGDVSETTTPRKPRQGQSQSVRRKQPPRQRRRPKKLTEEEEDDDQEETASSEEEQYEANNGSDPEEKPEVNEEEKPPVVSSSMNSSAISAIISNLIGMQDLNDSGKKVNNNTRRTSSTVTTSSGGGISTFQSPSTIDQILFQSMTHQQLSNNGPSSSSMGHSTTTGQHQYLHNNPAYPSPFTNPFHHQYPDMPNLLGRPGLNLISSLNNSNSNSHSSSTPESQQHQQYNNMGGHGMSQQEAALQQQNMYSPNHVYSPPPEQPQNLHFGNKYK